jgi:hypothetical protein
MKKREEELMCEACEKRPYLVKEDCDGLRIEYPYRLCKACHARILSRSLRPREVYNLVAIHGYCHYLNSDYYDDDGMASQPEEEFQLSKKDRIPSLDKVKNDLSQLIKYCVTKWNFSESLKDILSQYSNEEIFIKCKKRYDISIGYDVKIRLLKIAGLFRACGFCTWIKELWDNNDVYAWELELGGVSPTDEAFLNVFKSYEDREIKIRINKLIELIQIASSNPQSFEKREKEENEINKELVYFLQAMLYTSPSDETFDSVISALELLPEKLFPFFAYSSLHKYNSDKILEWMEKKIKSYDNYWIKLFLDCYSNWNNIDRWLHRGRPFSLIAIETIAAATYGGQMNIAGIPNLEVVDKIIEDYKKRDDVPRVNNAIIQIKNNISKFRININHRD